MAITVASPTWDALSPFILALVSAHQRFSTSPVSKGTSTHPQVAVSISSGLHKLLLAQTPSLHSLGKEADNAGRAAVILGTSSKGTQLKDLAGGLRFACRGLCVFSCDQSHCEKFWFSIHFFAYGKEDGFVQWLFKNTSKELESVHGCAIYKLK